MQALEVKSFLEGKLPETKVEVEGEGCNFQLNVISDELAANYITAGTTRPRPEKRLFRLGTGKKRCWLCY